MKNPSPGSDLSNTYTENFFAQHDKTFYLQLAQSILQVCDTGISSTLDIGCGHGFLVEAMRHHGMDAGGVEGSASARSLWPEAVRDKYQLCDLRALQDFSQLAAADLVTSFEVAEHLDRQFADHFIDVMTCHRPRFAVFGAATPYQDLDKNPTHVNEQPFRYWIERFDAKGYELHLLKTIALKESLFEKKRTHGVKWWYPKNAMVFVPAGTTAAEPGYLEKLSDVDSTTLTWRVRAKNPVFNLMADRDRLEYLHIVDCGVRSALKELQLRKQQAV